MHERRLVSAPMAPLQLRLDQTIPSGQSLEDPAIQA